MKIVEKNCPKYQLCFSANHMLMLRFRPQPEPENSGQFLVGYETPRFGRSVPKVVQRDHLSLADAGHHFSRIDCDFSAAGHLDHQVLA